jgi:hypothetical protein
MYVKLSWKPEVDHIYFQFLFLEPSVSQKNTKNQYALLPGITVRVLASHFSSVIGNFGLQGGLIYNKNWKYI